MALEYFNAQGVNTYINPMTSDGQLIHASNVVNFPFGALSKRPGYTSFLGAPDSAQINNLFIMPNINNSGLISLIRASGSALWSSTQGTGAWTQMGNGTITNGAYFGQAQLGTTLIGGDGIGSTRHTTDGTSFTNTTQAPVANWFAQYGNRIFAAGTNNTLLYSSAGSAANWSPAPPADSSSFLIPEAGTIGALFKVSDRLTITKSRGDMFRWDQNSLVDMCTNYGPSSPVSIGQMEDYRFFVNQYGHFGFDGNPPQLLSNAIQRYFYNKNDTGIPPANFATIPGVCHIYDYLAAIGTVTDDFSGRTINNAIMKYDYQKNQYLFWQFNDNPTAWLSYNDANNKRQLIFGNSSGQCFQLARTATSDNGVPISSEAVFLFTYAAQNNTFTQTSAQTIFGSSYEKKWNWIRLFFNPGDETNIQYAFSNTLTYQHLRWSEAINTKVINGDFWQVSDGVVEIRFPVDQNNMPRSRFLFLRLYEDSDNSSWQYMGCQIDAEIQYIK